MADTAATDQFRNSNFALAFFFLPKAEREAMQIVYAYCRILDDIVDEPGDPAVKRKELRKWEEELDQIYNGRPLDPLGRRLQEIVRQFHLSREPFQRIIDGCAMDLDHARYETFDDLYVYCTKVASAVGQCCIEIFGYENMKTQDYAEHLGVALQLTNILRDVGEDARRGRIYLPRQEMDRFGVTETDILAGRQTDNTRKLLEQFGKRAKGYYELAESEKHELEPKRLMAAEIMGAIYRKVLDRVEASGYDVFGAPLKLTTLEKASALAGVMARHYLRREAA
ncbi:MAG: presqualene diphosphate synthase HpnD [Deltaproteobacteria bacterium]|nr:presqualene diphosphate synthase HpnD [Deltaproteobacteria bacterium]